MRTLQTLAAAVCLLLSSAAPAAQVEVDTAPPAATDQDAAPRQWLAGDHHVHSEWSVTWDRSTTPPTPIRGGDSPYTRSRNAQQAAANGLAWMVHTDHGGPGHSRVTRTQAWPALQQARRAVPALIQFHGMEFDVPAAEHASLIIAPGADEQAQLERLERDYNRAELLDGSLRDTEPAMLAALHAMQAMQPQPLLIVNHPSRTATAPGVWGKVTPAELRAWQDAAPQVVIGMEGAPGHQADTAHRGLYRNAGAPTLGGFDQMTAQVGGVWDSLLAEGRHFWITATSDSHRNWRDGGAEFDPGEYSKTYVWAHRDPADILRALRAGQSFAVTGDRSMHWSCVWSRLRPMAAPARTPGWAARCRLWQARRCKCACACTNRSSPTATASVRRWRSWRSSPVARSVAAVCARRCIALRARRCCRRTVG